jgi:hypothetical protein
MLYLRSSNRVSLETNSSRRIPADVRLAAAADLRLAAAADLRRAAVSEEIAQDLSLRTSHLIRKARVTDRT